MKILIHTPISNRAWILPEWFAAVRGQSWPHDEIDLLFDVNDSPDETLALLRQYEREKHGFRFLITERSWSELKMPDHQWNGERYIRMRRMRNDALEVGRNGDYDFIFSLDSDVILHDSDTLAHLIEVNVPIIAGVFMSTWGNPEATPLPNVWEKGMNEMSDEFLEQVPKPEPHVHWRVGGLGACTLIRHDVWEKGVNYTEVYNLPSGYRGEDRDFCVRAAVAGFTMLACAHKQIEHRDKPKIGKEKINANHEVGRNDQEPARR
jgi:glycosyltransferase involved in cell wall biosynthesis